MGKTSAAVKNKWNDKNYDRINLIVPKGQKEIIKQYADNCGMSVNAFIQKAIEEKMAKDK